MATTTSGWWQRAGATVLGLVAVVYLVGTFTSSPPRPARPVTLTTGDWRPFVGGGLESDGPVAAVVAEAFRRLGYEPTVEVDSWPLAMDRVTRGEALGTFPFIRSDDREEQFLLSTPIVEFDYALFYYTPAWPTGPPVAEPADLSSLRVGIAEGYEVWPELAAVVDDFEPYATSEEAFTALVAGDIDILPEGVLPGRALVQDVTVRADAADFGVVEAAGHPALGTTESLHVLFARNESNVELVRSFDEAFAELRESQMYAESVATLTGGAADDVVELLPGRTGAVELFTSPSGDERIVTPRGTRAQVVAWPDDFLAPTTGGTAVPRVEVKVLDGPSRGRIVWVQDTAIALVQP